MGFRRLSAALLVGASVQQVSAVPTYPLVNRFSQEKQVQNGTSNGTQWVSEPNYPSPWMNPSATGWEAAYGRAKSFVSQLTLMEKVNITTGVGWQNGPCVGNTGSIPRLGFKGFCNQDSPQGVRDADYVSAFTSSQLAGATFDRAIWYARGVAMAEEHKGKGSTMQLGPVCGPLGRSPEGGRNWEGFGVDPVLSGIAVAETIKGIQDTGIVASIKHYIGNEQEHFRQIPEEAGFGVNITATLSSNIDDRSMHELYLWPFSDAVRAGVGSVLCSYTQINNSYGCQNSKTLNGLLKNELGFQGFVVSDWQGHHSGVSSALAGMDMSMPGDTVFSTGDSYWGSNLTIAVLNGTVPEWRIDDMAMRIMAAYFKVGNVIETQPTPNFNSFTYDTYGYKYAYSKEGYDQVNWHVDVRGKHQAQIRETAAKGTVLLKNNGSLPLKDPKLVAVIGEDAGGNAYGPNGCSDRGCDNGTLAVGWGSGSTQIPFLITPDAALSLRVASDGGRYESILNNSASDQIQALVSQQDATCIVFGNADSGEGYIIVDGNQGDRNNLTLWQGADQLIRDVSSWCNNTIVVLHTVGPVLVTDWYEHPNITAIVWAGVPGETSGLSLVDILYGDVNPAGRTPFTWAKKREDYGTDILYDLNNGHDAPQLTYTEGPYIDYRHFDAGGIEPIYEFGFGLSYTTFNYSNIQVVKHDVPAYTPTAGNTQPAPVLGNFSTSLADYAFPENWTYVDTFIYPYLNTTSSLAAASRDPDYASNSSAPLPAHATDGSAQPLLRSADEVAPGGNAALYDVLYQVSAVVTNTGDVAGDEVVQLYVELSGDNPPRQLRDFARLSLQPGHSGVFTGQLTRRDLSNWDVVVQDWVVSEEVKTAFVGSSSRRLALNAKLE